MRFEDQQKKRRSLGSEKKIVAGQSEDSKVSWGARFGAVWTTMDLQFEALLVLWLLYLHLGGHVEVIQG